MFIEDKVYATPAANVENGIQTEYFLGNLFKLRAPVVYKLEDMVMSLMLFLIILLAILILYGFTRCFIYLAFHKTKTRIQDLKTVEEFV